MPGQGLAAHPLVRDSSELAANKQSSLTCVKTSASQVHFDISKRKCEVFRPRFEPRCYLAFGRDGCVDVYTPEAFEQMATETMEKVKQGEISRDEQRALAANAFDVTVDAQGRLNVDRELRDYAGLQLGTKVVLAGSFDHVEIWNAETYERVVARGGASLIGSPPAGGCRRDVSPTSETEAGGVGAVHLAGRKAADERDAAQVLIRRCPRPSFLCVGGFRSP